MNDKTNTSKIVKDRPTTEKKLVDAVGKIIKSDGYRALGVNRIASVAGVNKNLIYRYFGSVDTLVERYIREKDYWLGDNAEFKQVPPSSVSKKEMIKIISGILQNQLSYFYNSDEMQHIILSEISDNSTLLAKLSKLREEMGEQFFSLTEKYFENKDVNFRGIAAIIVSGIYYLVLQSQKNEAINCGINLRTFEGQKTILKSINQIIEWSFNAGSTK